MISKEDHDTLMDMTNRVSPDEMVTHIRDTFPDKEDTMDWERFWGRLDKHYQQTGEEGNSFNLDEKTLFKWRVGIVVFIVFFNLLIFSLLIFNQTN